MMMPDNPYAQRLVLPLILAVLLLLLTFRISNPARRYVRSASSSASFSSAFL
jgi:hypothetical protein